jgi:3alpha(or 20beta)-hydroxysteroid dehydrogenase
VTRQSAPPSPTGGRLGDRVIVVTGARGGLGSAMVMALAEAGAHVVATDVEAPDGPALDVQRIPGTVVARALDVASPAGWSRLVDWLRERFGRVDGLVNNAGVTSRVRLTDVALEEWNRVLAVNLTGPMLGIQALYPMMGEGASIVNVGSVAALTGHYAAAYTTSKWGVRGLTQVAATELGPLGVRVNAVHPGYIDTPMTAGAPPAFREANLTLTPLGRAGRAAEVAALIVFLMSSESSYLNGAEIPVDGGLSGNGTALMLSAAVRGPRIRLPDTLRRVDRPGEDQDGDGQHV